MAPSPNSRTDDLPSVGDPGATVDAGRGSSEPPRERDALTRLRQRAGERYEATTAALITALAEACYRRAPVETVRQILDAPDPVVDWLAHAIALIDARVPDLFALEVRDDERGTIVEIATEDMPFLVSTVLEEVGRFGEEIVDVLHPVLGVQRQAGRFTGLQPARDAERRESLVWLQLGRRLDAERREQLRACLADALEKVRAVTSDFGAMTARAKEVAAELRRQGPRRWPPEDVDEVAALMEWLLDDHFVWLGARDYWLVDADGAALAVDPDSGLGLLRDAASSSFAEPVRLEALPPEVAAAVRSDEPLTVSRTNRRSPVHKRVRMMSLSVAALDADGQPAGERRFLGLLAQRAYAEPASTTPLLRRKLERILAAEDVVAHSHDERALRTLFEAFPRHELFAADTEHLRATIVDLLESQRRQQVRLWCHAEPGGRGIAALLTVPRERFNSTFRRRVQRLLTDRFGAGDSDYHLSMAEGDAALLHFVLHVDPRAMESVDVESLERRIVELARTWDDAVAIELGRVSARADAKALAERYHGAFDDVYQAATEPSDAAADIVALEAVRTGSEPVALRLVWTGDDRIPVRARLVKRGEGVELSAFVPILESLGFVVVEQVPHYLEVDGSPLQLHDFGVRTEGVRDVDIDADHGRLADAVSAIWHGRAEADLLNRLVLDARMTWRDVAILRAYRRYRRQIGTGYTETYQDEAIVSNPAIAAALVGLFRARVDPREDGSEPALKRARADVAEALDAVEHLDQDRILRRFAGTIEATIRSNVAVTAGEGHGSDALALKVASADVPEIAAPVPHAEIFVHHPSMEGIHLRGGRVARGGVRASDRREDFRTEVLDLMKAQMTKNAVIVPTGAKGGFVLRHPPPEPGVRAEATAEAYRRYVRALLDVTDDVEAGRVVAPANVRRRDDDDPYLVVAPDKGTATLSDEANQLAQAYGFWLGDAFATGGVTGYDHKGLGVTARGAWVAVQRHFRELGVDVQADPIRVVGIGDMGGDVFGNGMLQSRQIKLVGAFDHRHVFIDPDPDPEASYVERERLFHAADSSWQGYDRGQLSPGGGVWSRQAKSIALSDEARALLDVDAAAISPPALIRALLLASVDLLFLGGIGTFVKASTEAHDAVGDRVNESIRVDADALRARAVGEGANLGFTQRARIEYARRGGRINTDAVDNAAGVGTSDREVNLKLALDAAVAAGELSTSDRNALLQEVTEPVVAGVLADVDRQAGGLSHEVEASAGDLSAHDELMRRLEHHGESPAPAGRLDRELEVLPSSAELHRRAEAGAGLSRPEVAVLMGYAKLDLRDALVRSSVPDDPVLEALLAAYFPDTVARAAPTGIDAHPLRRELIATRATNDVVDRMGLTWVDRVVRQLGADTETVLSAYWAARTLLDAPGAWEAVARNELFSDPLLTAELRDLVNAAVDHAARTTVRLGIEGIGDAVDRDRPAAEAIARAAGELGTDAQRRRRRGRIERFCDLGVARDDAERLVDIGEVATAPDVAAVARRTDRPPRTVADVHQRVGDALPFAQLVDHLERVQPRGLWQRWQRQGLAEELQHARRAVTERVLARHPDRDAPGAVAEYLAARPRDRRRIDDLLQRLDDAETVGLDAIAVVARALRDAFAA